MSAQAMQGGVRQKCFFGTSELFCPHLALEGSVGDDDVKDMSEATAAI